MATFNTPRILISGVGSQVGKSIITLGLIGALRKRKLSVSVVVTGPNLAQSVIFYRLTRRYCRCLDANLLTKAQLRFELEQASIGADVLLIDGSHGLFDGTMSSNPLVSDSSLAIWSNTPVVLVVDGANVQESISPIVRGFWAASEGFPFVGIIANHIKTTEGKGRTESVRFERALLRDQLDCYLGGFPYLSEKGELPAELFTQKGNSSSLSRGFLIEAAEAVEKYVKIEAILSAAAEAGAIGGDSQKDRLGRRCRIGISDDNCFGLSVQNNLELLRFYGAELVPFSPMADGEVPDRVSALYFSGAFLYEYAAELSANISFRKSAQDFVQRGGLVYAEGSSAAFLCENLNIPGGGVFEGLGLVPAIAEAAEGSFTYSQITLQQESVLGSEGVTLKGMNARDWKVVPNPGLQTTMSIKNQDGSVSLDGFSPSRNVLATFALPHFGSNPAIAKHFVDLSAMNKIK
jgi:cobyrinic acid a,c-diamide synthase